MLFQVEVQNVGIGLVNSIFIYLTSIFIIKWYSKRKNDPYMQVWDISFKTAMKLSLIWFLINLSLGLTFDFFLKNVFLYLLIQDFTYLITNVISGIFIVYFIYKKTIRESFDFVIIIQIIVFGISIFLGFILVIIFGYLYPEISNALFFIIRVGLFNTIYITIIGLIIGLAIGLILAIMRVYGGKELYWLAGGYEKIFRGIPLIVLIYIFAYGLPGLFWYLKPLDRLLPSVILALGIRSGAYQSQIFRGAILSVNPGQMEASLSLGMNKIQSFHHIILPQALRLAIPGWSNEFAIVIKDSSFAGVAGLVVELTKAAYIWGNRSVNLFTLSMGIIAIIYFIITFPVTRLLGERQTKKLKELGMGGG